MESWQEFRDSLDWENLGRDERAQLARQWYMDNMAGLSLGESDDDAANRFVTRMVDEAPVEEATTASDVGEEVVRGVAEIPRVAAGALANIFNTPSELANLGRVGVNALTGSDYSPIPNLVELPEEAQPTTPIGGAMADILPMLIPSRAGVGIASRAAGDVAREATGDASREVAGRVVREVEDAAGTAAETATRTVKMTSGTGEAPDVADFMDEAKQRMEENPSEYEGMSQRDVALRLRDAVWAGRKAGQAILGGTVSVGNTGTALARGSKLGAVGAGAEGAQQGVEESLGGDEVNPNEVIGMGALGAALGVGSRFLERAVTPGNQERIGKMGENIRKQESAAQEAQQAQETIRQQQRLANKFKPTQQMIDDDYPLGAFATGEGGIMVADDVASDALTRSMQRIQRDVSPDELQWVKERYYPNLSQDEFFSKRPAEIARTIEEDDVAAKAFAEAQKRVSDQGVPLLQVADAAEEMSKGFSGSLAPDLSRMLPATREAMGATGLSQLLSRGGASAEGALFAPRMLRQAQTTKAEEGFIQGAISDLENYSLAGMRQGNLAGISRQEVEAITKRMAEALKSGRDLTEDELERLSKLQARSNDFIIPSTGDSLASPLEIYNKARAAQKATKQLEGDENTATGVLGSMALGYATGGLSYAGQGALVGLKQGVDRPMFNDLRRSAAASRGQASPVTGDATRSAVGDATRPISESVESAALPYAAYSQNQEGEVEEVSQSPWASEVETVESDFFQSSTEAPQGSQGLSTGMGPQSPRVSQESSQDGSQGDSGPISLYTEADTGGVVGGPEQLESAPWSQPTSSAGGLDSYLYNAFAQAETGGESNPWIRTRAKDPSTELHSSAYGPVQITYTLAQDYLNRKPELFTDVERDYLTRYVNQGKSMIAASNGYTQDERLQYGGEGYLTEPLDKELYKSVAQKMLRDTYERQEGNLTATIRAWRGVDDPTYARRVIDALPS